MRMSGVVSGQDCAVTRRAGTGRGRVVPSIVERIGYRTAFAALRWYVRYAPGTLGKRSLVRNLLDSGLQRHPYRCTARTGWGARFAVDTADIIQRYLYLFGVWEPHLTGFIRSRLQPGDVFVDVGANVGYYTLLGARLVGDRAGSGSVVAIEASADSCAVLRHNLSLNATANARPVNVAVSDRAETLVFYQEEAGNLGATTIVRPAGRFVSSFDMRAESLQQILTRDEIARTRLIKIDVEGAEAAAVRGLVPLLAMLRPDVEIVIELSPDFLAVRGESPDDVTRPFLDRGFNIYRLTNSYLAESYVRAVPRRPVRWRGPVTEQSDLVFSRADAEELSTSG